MNKQTLLAALFYPRFHIRNNLRQRDCPFNNEYRADELACGWCLYQEECCWLNHHDDDSRLAGMSVDELLKILAFTVDYVDTDIAFWEHDSRHCGCEACRWLRDARRELDSSSFLLH